MSQLLLVNAYFILVVAAYYLLSAADRFSRDHPPETPAPSLEIWIGMRMAQAFGTGCVLFSVLVLWHALRSALAMGKRKFVNRPDSEPTDPEAQVANVVAPPVQTPEIPPGETKRVTSADVFLFIFATMAGVGCCLSQISPNKSAARARELFTALVMWMQRASAGGKHDVPGSKEKGAILDGEVQPEASREEKEWIGSSRT
ncbi:hypothetical protein FB45DRAFT_1037529 [Roridomyces roridus]|uniref:Uncharacterized protein n=1 Tax=Roridomyces roridus TaxID=1738132 RepID=A0AAD7FBY5_9AGAR|nr:hypothetical protein FB45DRAFT_1037529 [Roridomyces roridus]